LLKRWRYRARLVLAGAISELLMLGIQSTDGRVLFSYGNDMMIELPQIICSVALIRFLMLDP